MSDSHGKKASVGDVKRIIRRKLAKHPEHEEMSLNIYPMMDMMTILLVFLIMQFAQESANIVQSDELQIPYSVATETAEMSVPLTITHTQILVEGHPVVALRNDGRVDPSLKQGGGNGFLITDLAEVMQQHKDRLELIAQHNPSRPFRGDLQIIADKRTPFRTLSEVIYTCGQRGFTNIRFVVLKRGS